MTKHNKLFFLSTLFRSMAGSINLSTGLILIQSITTSDVMATVIRSLAFFSTSLFTKPLNMLAIKIGRKRAIWLSCILNTISTLLILLASIINSSFVMVIAVLLSGVGAAGLMQTRFFLTEETKSGSSKLLARYMLVSAIGSIIGPSIVGMKFAALNQFTSTYLIVLLLTILGTLSFYFVEDRTDNVSTNKNVIKNKLEKISLDYFFSGLSHAFIQFIMTGTMTIIPLYLSKNGASLEIIGMMMSLHMIGMYLFSPLVSWFYEKIGAKLISVTFFFVIVTELCCFITESLVYGGINLFVIGLAWSSINISATMEMSKLPKEKLGWQGIFDTLSALFGGFGVLISGALLKVGGYQFVLVFYSILSLIILLGKIYGSSKRDMYRRTV
ncbi:MAG: MFS transporter [Streptococcaceae bacterium]|nr:MFS transporter [Streptococcaceae bacterium]